MAGRDVPQERAAYAAPRRRPGARPRRGRRRGPPVAVAPARAPPTSRRAGDARRQRTGRRRKSSCAACSAATARSQRAVPGEDQRGEARARPLDAPEELDAVDAGQLDVADHEIPVAPVDDLEVGRRWVVQRTSPSVPSSSSRRVATTSRPRRAESARLRDFPAPCPAAIREERRYRAGVHVSWHDPGELRRSLRTRGAVGTNPGSRRSGRASRPASPRSLGALVAATNGGRPARPERRCEPRRVLRAAGGRPGGRRRPRPRLVVRLGDHRSRARAEPASCTRPAPCSTACRSCSGTTARSSPRTTSPPAPAPGRWRSGQPGVGRPRRARLAGAGVLGRHDRLVGCVARWLLDQRIRDSTSPGFGLARGGPDAPPRGRRRRRPRGRASSTVLAIRAAGDGGAGPPRRGSLDCEAERARRHGGDVTAELTGRSRGAARRPRRRARRSSARGSPMTRSQSTCRRSVSSGPRARRRPHALAWRATRTRPMWVEGERREAGREGGTFSGYRCSRTSGDWYVLWMEGTLQMRLASARLGADTASWTRLGRELVRAHGARAAAPRGPRDRRATTPGRPRRPRRG